MLTNNHKRITKESQKNHKRIAKESWRESEEIRKNDVINTEMIQKTQMEQVNIQISQEFPRIASALMTFGKRLFRSVAMATT